MTAKTPDLTNYLLGRSQLEELARGLQLHRSRFHQSVLRGVHDAMEALGHDYEHVPDIETLQRARRHLLAIRKPLYHPYAHVPQLRKLKRFYTDALKLAMPGEDDPPRALYGR